MSIEGAVTVGVVTVGVVSGGVCSSRRSSAALSFVAPAPGLVARPESFALRPPSESEAPGRSVRVRESVVAGRSGGRLCWLWVPVPVGVVTRPVSLLGVVAAGAESGVLVPLPAASPVDVAAVPGPASERVPVSGVEP
jgi:hypothetical protein